MRWSELNQEEEIQVVEGADLRLPQYRRDAFLKFYSFQLQTRGHAGSVYMIFPYLFDKMNMTTEQKLWFVYLNGNTQNPITTLQIFREFPDFNNLDLKKFSDWYDKKFKELQWDTDRRHQKSKFIDGVTDYVSKINGGRQEDYFNSIIGDGKTKYDRFDLLWETVYNEFAYFGRLSSFSYIEFLWIAGLDVDCSNLFIDDIKGSKSHRNGICKVIGRDDWEWKDNDVVYTKEMLDFLEQEGEKLLQDAKRFIRHPDVSYFTLETALCSYKGSFRNKRRYAGVYLDMMHDRVKKAEQRFPNEDFSILWDCRKSMIPEWMRMEDTNDIGLVKFKQNYFRNTGHMPMMGHLFPEFGMNYVTDPRSKQTEQLTLW